MSIAFAKLGIEEMLPARLLGHEGDCSPSVYLHGDSFLINYQFTSAHNVALSPYDVMKHCV